MTADQAGDGSHVDDRPLAIGLHGKRYKMLDAEYTGTTADRVTALSKAAATATRVGKKFAVLVTSQRGAPSGAFRRSTPQGDAEGLGLVQLPDAVDPGS